MKNILVVNVNWLGDVVFSSPIFKALKQFYPEARVVCMAPERVRLLAAHIEGVDAFICLDERNQQRSWLAKWRLVQTIKKERFDIVFLLHRSWTRALLVYLAGIPVRVGYDVKRRGMFLTHRIQEPYTLLHRSEIYLKVVEAYRIPVNDRTTTLIVNDDQRRDIGNILKERGISQNDRFIVFNPGGNWNLKRWPVEQWRKLLQRVIARTDIRVIISGAEKDKVLSDQLISGQGSQVIDLTGQTSLSELMALFERSDLLVTADSGPMHIGHSVGTAVLALFGPTRPELTRPLGPGPLEVLQYEIGCNQESCYYLDCPQNTCMRAISVQDVYQMIIKLCHDMK
ncbi:MAG: lipopolysaccharide heptosyltransferase II [Candidatus Omnitrophica bacterium]|nr:lipopolysaccharide heptosyltransferase II [Candidatus Omnitrophota bacterium]